MHFQIPFQKGGADLHLYQLGIKTMLSGIILAYQLRIGAVLTAIVRVPCITVSSSLYHVNKLLPIFPDHALLSAFACAVTSAQKFFSPHSFI